MTNASRCRRTSHQIAMVWTCTVIMCCLFVGWCLRETLTALVPTSLFVSEPETASRSDQLAAHLDRLREDDPEGDAERDFAAGKVLFAGFLGEPDSLIFPAIAFEDWHDLRTQYRYWSFDGVSDLMPERKLVQRAFVYGERYNTRMSELASTETNSPWELDPRDARKQFRFSLDR